MIAKEFKGLLETLCNFGLGNYLILHKSSKHVFFGHLVFEKGNMGIHDTGLLNDLSPQLFAPVWDDGLIGMISQTDKHEWDSLTFYGTEECDVTPDLGATRNSALASAENEYGDNLINFTGTVYRGFELMLENSFLPVVLLKPIKSKSGDMGLVVADLRTAPMKIDLLIKLNEMVVKSIEKYRVLNVDDVEMTTEDFENYFGAYIP
jgi:hypothetical protein